MTALLGEQTAYRAKVSISGYGLPWIEATLTEAATLTGAQVFQIGGVSVNATIVAGGTFEGKARYRLVGGAGGWGAVAKRKAYNDDAGVKFTKIATDLANEVGETLGTVPTDRRGPHYARQECAAFLTLHELAPRGWYVDLAGVTHFGARPVTTYTGDGTIVRTDPAARLVELACDRLDTSLVPGVSIGGNPPATDVEWEIGETRLTVRAFWGAPKGDTRIDAWTQLFEALFPNLRYAGTFEYRVVNQEGERLNLQPVRSSTGMPVLARVPVRPGVSGFRSDVSAGELVLVQFADRDPSRPNVTSHDHADSEGWLPDVTELGRDTDFLATKTAIDTLQQAFDSFTTTTYPAHTHGTGVGPTTPVAGSPPSPVGALPSTDVLKASHGA